LQKFTFHFSRNLAKCFHELRTLRSEGDLVVPPRTNEEIQALKNKLLENARLQESVVPLTSINFETAKQYQGSRPSLRSLKTLL